MLIITYIQLSNMELFNPQKKSGKTLADLYEVSYNTKMSVKSQPVESTKNIESISLNEKKPTEQLETQYTFNSLEDFQNELIRNLHDNLINDQERSRNNVEYLRCIPKQKQDCLSVCSDQNDNIVNCDQKMYNIANYQYSDSSCYVSHIDQCNGEYYVVDQNELVLFKDREQLQRHFEDQLLINLYKDYTQNGEIVLERTILCVLQDIVGFQKETQSLIDRQNNKVSTFDFKTSITQKIIDCID